MESLSIPTQQICSLNLLTPSYLHKMQPPPPPQKRWVMLENADHMISPALDQIMRKPKSHDLNQGSHSSTIQTKWLI